MNKLSNNCSSISSLFDAKISFTSTNKKKYVTMLNSIDSRSRDYQVLLNKIKKTAAILFADRHFLQETNHSLFKANMKKQKERVTKKKNARLFIVFERVLTSAQTTKLRQDAMKKKTFLKKKRESTEARKRERAENKEKKAFEKERMMKIKRQQMIKIKRQKQLKIEMKNEAKRIKEEEIKKKKMKMKKKRVETERKKIEMIELRMTKKRQKKENSEMISKRRKRN